MNEETKLRDWIELFNKGTFDKKDHNIQNRVGWYSFNYWWFFGPAKLAGKTKRMGNIIKQLKDSSKVDLDNDYVWFKNSYPMPRPLYDTFRIAKISDDSIKYLIQLNSPWQAKRYKIFGHDNDFKEPLLETNYAKDVVAYLNS